MPFFDRLLKHLEATYPKSAFTFKARERLSPLLFCPRAVPLDDGLRQQAVDIVRAFWALRNESSRKSSLEAQRPNFTDPGNTSALMSFDFHVDHDKHLRLIEINTNASMALPTELIYDIHGLSRGFDPDPPTVIAKAERLPEESFRREIVSTFANESRLCGKDPQSSLRVAIVDEEPTKQRMYIEFLMYQELFESVGWRAEILDAKDLRFSKSQLMSEPSHEPIDLVYNRLTDFYLQEPRNSALRAAVEHQAACVSPHPHEYRLLADKARLMELSDDDALAPLALSNDDKDIIRRTLIPTVRVGSFASPDELWAQRKKWFFKTERSYGGKAAYRGSSVSRTVFQNIVRSDYVAQEYVPAPAVAINIDGTKTEFKYDLRFFVYQDRIQLACARLYQGQLTNFKTAGGGLAAIEWD